MNSSEVFQVDTRNDLPSPRFKSKFPVDFGIRRSDTHTVKDTQIWSRLTAGCMHSTMTDAETTGYPDIFMFNNGFMDFSAI